MATSVMGVMEMANIVPRMGIKLTSLVFRARAVTNTPPRLPDVTILLTPTCLSGSLPERSVQTTILFIGQLRLNHHGSGGAEKQIAAD